MNLLQLVLKQMRQRALSTWLTMLSILLGVALAVAILVLRREGQNLFAQSDFGYDILVGPPKGSPLQLIRALCTEVGASLLLVSHDLAIANQFPRVLTLADVNRAGRRTTATPSQSPVPLVT